MRLLLALSILALPALYAQRPSDTVEGKRVAVQGQHQVDPIAVIPATAENLVADVRRAISAATGRSPSESPWTGLISPTDRVGIKITADGTDQRVVRTIIDSLRNAGVPMSRIFIWDRNQRELEKHGWLNARGQSTLPGIAVKFIPPGAGYDPGKPIYSPVAGALIWGDRDFQQRTTQAQISNVSHLSFVFTSQADKVIHLGVARIANGIGLHGAVSGALIDNLDNWRRFYTKGGWVGIEDAWAAAEISSRIVLHIIDARSVQIADGPRRNFVYERPLGVFLASREPFGLDRRLLDLIEPLVLAAKLPSPKKDAQWLRSEPVRGPSPNTRPPRI